MKISKEVKAGILVVVAISFLIFGFNFMKGRNLLVLQRKFYAVYKNINGIVEANPVLVNGYQVGQVSDIKFTPDYSGNIVVEFVIRDNDLRIPKNSILRIFSPDLLGSKAVELVLGDSSEIAGNKDTLRAETEESINEALSRQLVPLKNKAESLISSMDSVMIVVKEVFNAKNKANIDKSLLSLKNAMGNFDTLMEDERVKIGMITKNMESITNNLKNNNEKISAALKNIASITDSVAKSNLAGAINNASKALAEVSVVMSKVNKGEGSLGLLIHNDSLYDGLNRAATDLDKLILDMKEHPKRYIHFSVFGRKDK